MKTLPSSLSIHRKLQSGFSLIETMVVIVLVSIAATVAIPSFRDSITRNNLVAAANEFQLALSQARSEAIRSRVNTVMQSVANKDWTQGWVVYTDKNYNNVQDGTDGEVAVRGPMTKGMTVSDNGINPGLFVFQSSGFPSFVGIGGQMRGITFTMNDQSTTVCVSTAGSARVIKGNKCE